MSECERCGSIEGFLFECPNCGGQYCEDHQDPAKHYCGVGSTDSEIVATATDTESATGSSVATDSADTARGTQRRRAVVLVVVGLVLLAGGAAALANPQGLGGLAADTVPWLGGPQPEESAGDPLNATEVERGIATELNQRRQGEGVSQIAYNATLAEIAASHSADMAARNYTAHESPDGEDVLDRYEQFGYECGRAGEVILRIQPASEVRTGGTTPTFAPGDRLVNRSLDAWFESPPRRRVLLNDSWTQVGVGVAVANDSTVYLTVNFCAAGDGT